MAGKRGATSDLNHDNWDADLEPEDAGTFKRASEDVLQRRVIKTAKRRNPSADDSSKVKGVFSGFAGFMKPSNSSTTPQSSPFSFLSTSGSTNLLSSSPKMENKSNGSNTSSSSPAKLNFKPRENEAKYEKPDEYYAKLKGLNESVSAWIKSHVDINPMCILSPIFKDYEEHLAEINKQYKEPEKPTKLLPQQQPPPTTSIFGSASSSLFSSATKKEETKPPEKFQFNSTPSTSTFTFGSGAPFQFTNVARPSTATTSEEAEDEEPPKVEFKPVVEDGSVYTKRCKVFVKTKDNFGDRGVGQLFLKPVEGSEKMQLIVRADTNLGNLLLNFILTKSIPLQRMGKNNVMLVSIPLPDSKPPPTPILLRVKTAEEADELLAVLEKYQN